MYMQKGFLKCFNIIFISIILLPSFLPGQDSKSTGNKAICSTPVPSRFSSIRSHQKGTKKVAGTPSQTLSCCKGAPSRTRLTAAASRK